MKNIKIFKGLLLTSTVVWSVLSSPLSAVSLEAVRTYWSEYRTIESFDPQALDKLTMLDKTQWKQFQELVRSFILGRTYTQYLKKKERDREILDRAREILALKDLPPEILFHDEFSNGLLAFALLENRHYNFIPIIKEIQKHRKHFTENFSNYALFQALGNEGSLLKETHLVKALKTVPQESINHPDFMDTLRLLKWKEMPYDEQTKIIETLSKIEPKKLVEFANVVAATTAGPMKPFTRYKVILALADLSPEILFHPAFSRSIAVFFRMYSQHHDRLEAIQEIKKHANFFKGSFSHYAFFQALGDEKSTLKDNPIVKELKRVPIERINNPKFWGIFNPALTIKEDYRFGYRFRNSAIQALTNLDYRIFFHREFPKGITTFLKMFDTEDDLQHAIDEIGSNVSLFKKKFSYYALFQALGDYGLVEELKMLPQNIIDHPEFWKTLHQLVIEGQREEGSILAIKALGKFPPEKWGELVETFNSITQGRKEDERKEVLETLAGTRYTQGIKPKNWDKFFQTFNTLRKFTANSSQLTLIRSLKNVSPQDWEIFEETAQALITPNMDEETRKAFLYSLANVDSRILWDRRFIPIVQALMTPDMAGGTPALLISSLNMLGYNIIFHRKFVKKMKGLTTPDMDGETFAMLVNSLCIFDQNTLFHRKFVKTIQGLKTEKMTGKDLMTMINIFGRSSHKTILHPKFPELTRALMTDKMTGTDHALLISDLTELPNKIIFSPKFIKYSSKIMKILEPEENNRRISIIFDKLKPENLKRFSTHACALMQEMITVLKSDTICGITVLKLNRMSGEKINDVLMAGISGLKTVLSKNGDQDLYRKMIITFIPMIEPKRLRGAISCLGYDGAEPEIADKLIKVAPYIRERMGDTLLNMYHIHTLLKLTGNDERKAAYEELISDNLSCDYKKEVNIKKVEDLIEAALARLEKDRNETIPPLRRGLSPLPENQDYS